MMLLINVALGALLCVFGAIVMGLEILASNLMAPYFGGSIYVWGSIISSFMLHLAIGYAIGSWLAQRGGELTLLLWLLVFGALGVALLPTVYKPFCSLIADHIEDIRYGSLAAMLLLASPVLLLAMLCPYLIEYFARRRLHDGLSSGPVLLLSTFGSFLGTNLTAFYLIDLFPIPTILRVLGGAGAGLGLLLLSVNLDRRLQRLRAEIPGIDQPTPAANRVADPGI